MEKKYRGNFPQLVVMGQCVSCDSCRLLCPEHAILKSDQGYTIDAWSCSHCYLCLEVCPADCIKIDWSEDLEEK